MSVPFEENHELHGALLGLTTAVALRTVGRPFAESLTVGTAVGALATAGMKTYGHPDFVKRMVKAPVK